MDSNKIGAWFRKGEYIPIIIFAVLALLGLILYLNFDTPYHVTKGWIRRYDGTNSVLATSKSDYEFALEHIAGNTVGYFGGIALLAIGIIGTVVSAILVHLMKKDGGQTVNCYCDIVKHVLLLVFTFGIYYLIWIYRITGYLNQVKDEPPRKQASELLLCMFIPFYAVFWVYKSAQRLDKLAVSKGVPSDITTICLILAIFVGIVPPIIMQDKINAIVNTESKN